MRKLTDVIKEMTLVIPAENAELIDGLNGIRVSSSLSAPEFQYHWWTECRDLLVSHIGDSEEQWATKVKETFRGRE